MAACRKDSMMHGTFALTQAGRVDRKAFNVCMERKGYTVSIER